MLEAADTIYFDSTLQNGYRRLHQKPCPALIVTVLVICRVGSGKSPKLVGVVSKLLSRVR